MSEDKPSVTVVVPAYNEEPTLEQSILRTLDTFRACELDFELIIVNDASADKTGTIADELSRRLPEVDVAHHESNRGIGGAFKTGISKGTKDYVMFVPVDNPLEVDDLQAYLCRMGICDIIVGYRAERVGYTSFARFASFVYNRLLVPLLFNIGITDVNWIQAYRRQLFADGVLSYENEGLFWLVEVLVNARSQRLIIAEVPSKMKKRLHGKATCTRVSVMIATLIAMLRFFRRRLRENSQS